MFESDEIALAINTQNGQLLAHQTYPEVACTEDHSASTANDVPSSDTERNNF
jgi:hypothetical protein